jgi:hypothetical protein
MGSTVPTQRHQNLIDIPYTKVERNNPKIPMKAQNT